MSVYLDIWEFTRSRLESALEGLSDPQLRWRPFFSPDSHCIYEYVYHIAAAEHYWACRMTDRNPRSTDWEEKLDRAVREGFFTDGPFPFHDSDFSIQGMWEALNYSAQAIRPILANPSDQQLDMKIESPAGPIVTGKEGLWRVVQHPSYHTGQIWLLRFDPRFQP